MSEMVERVARIIDPEARWAIESPHDVIDQSLHRAGDRFAWVERRDAALEKARAAIAAMREPTEAMLHAGLVAVNLQGSYLNVVQRAMIDVVYRAMIDEALK